MFIEETDDYIIHFVGEKFLYFDKCFAKLKRHIIKSINYYNCCFRFHMNEFIYDFKECKNIIDSIVEIQLKNSTRMYNGFGFHFYKDGFLEKFNYCISSFSNTGGCIKRGPTYNTLKIVPWNENYALE